MTNEQYIQAAREGYQRTGSHRGDIEIDEGAEVSRGSDKGAYVQAWVWVNDPGAPEGGSIYDQDAPENQPEEVK